ncbi:MAG TPA: hypothetical protein VFZ70_15905 [Euzebyales bacterium]
MVALLMLAAGFALGLFFGWLLHRERVERALYEDVARHRDRATAALAETSARLELANKDMIRLRSQLSDSQQLLDERDATIADLRTRRPERPTGDDEDADVAEGVTGGPVDAVADAATTPSGVTRLDDVDRTDITEEVSLAARGPSRTESAVDADLGDENDHTIDVTPPANARSAGGVDDAAWDEPVRDEPAAQEVAAPVGGEPADAGPVAVEPVEDEAPDVTADEAATPDAGVAAEGAPATGDAAPVDEPAGDRELSEAGADAELDQREIGEPLVVDEPAVGTVVGGAQDQPEIGEPLVVDGSTEPAAETTAASEPSAGPDDLQRIAGIGPALELQLRAEGITSYRRLALLDDDTIADLQARRPQLVTRMRRGGWAAQARRLHAEMHGESL